MYPTYPYYGYEKKCENVPVSFPPQHQEKQPGLEYLMNPKPISDNPYYKGSGKLKNKTAIITGGDSAIGRAAAIAYAKEQADVVIVYLDEHKDAQETKKTIEKYGGKCLLIAIDLRKEDSSLEVVKQTVETFGQIDILVNNHAVQFPQDSLLDISAEQLLTTFQTNILSYFHLTKAVLPYLGPGYSIINTTSVNAYRGNQRLIDYSSTKGALVSFTRSLSLSLAKEEIRVNAVAPGPLWTPLIPSTFSAEDVKFFGIDTPARRVGQPFELAPVYVYLASDDSRYMSGQVLHLNGGEMVES